MNLTRWARWMVFALVLGLVAAAAGSLALAQHSGQGVSPSFSVEFSDCIETIGVGLVPTAAAQALVPPEFHVVGEGTPVTPLVVRTANCGGISIDGRPAKPGTIVQIGAVIVPPDFTGDINNYTFWYYTTNRELAQRLIRAGVRAQYVPEIELSYEASGPGVPSAFHVGVPLPGNPPFELDGFVVESDALAGSFRANWWTKLGNRIVKMDTNVPEIYIGGGDLVLTTDPNNRLGQLIGGDTLGFPIIQQFNVFSSALMQVGVFTP